jgi:WD repeat-containing protein 23
MQGVLTTAQLMALLQARNFLGQQGGDDDDDDDDHAVDEMLSFWGPRRSRRSPPKDPERFPKIPNPEGMKLQRSGVFGANDYDFRRKKKYLARRTLERELAIGDREERKRNNDLLIQVSPLSVMRVTPTFR